MDRGSTIEIYRDLRLHGSDDRIAALIACIRGSLSDGWSRAIEYESILNRGENASPTYCFQCEPMDMRPGGVLFIRREDGGDLWSVSNILSLGGRDLSIRQYNSFLEEFHRDFVVPFESAGKVTSELTTNRFDLTDALSPAAVEKLVAFSSRANKFTGTGHPDDRDRWLDFLLTAHREDAKLLPDYLGRWFAEVEGWPDDVVEQLVAEYEYGQAVLEYSDSHR